MVPRAIPVALLVLLTQNIGCTRENTAISSDAADHTAPPKELITGVAQQTSQNEGTERFDITPATEANSLRTRESAPSIHLVAESKFIEYSGLSRAHAEEVLGSSAGFSRALDEMSSEAAKIMEAQDLADHYRSALTQAVGTDGAVASLSCGLSMCMGSVHTRLGVDNDQWAQRFLDAPSTRVFGHLAAVEKIGDLNESRFIFSTDPDIPGIFVPLDD
ncbi:hypothetical protein [Stenotrophomonas sp. AB1(2024)]|uniref:hypothetical protein n=1 Tax=Stenotrophomonas sp. AB1(2024) TaxID=3132215 RepID=UPI0030B001AA